MDCNNLFIVIDRLPDLRFTGGVSELAIKEAEKQLNLMFAPEYILYLKKYGQIEANGIELTGLSSKITTSVVNATNILRKVGNIPTNMYVIEDLEIDGIEFLQDETGKIYQYIGKNKLTLYAQSLEEYIVSSYSN